MLLFNYTFDNILFIGSLLFFAAYLLVIIKRRIASRPDCFRHMAKILIMFAAAYFVGALVVAGVYDEKPFLQELVAIAIGVFCFITYYFVVFVPIIGLANRSISANVLAVIEQNGGTYPRVGVSKLLASTEDSRAILDDKLQQLTFLKFAEHSKNIYTLSKFGRFINMIPATFLKLWGLKPL